MRLKKCLSIVICLLMVFIPYHVSANEKSDIYDMQEKTLIGNGKEVSPYAISQCGQYSTHNMVYFAKGMLYNTSTKTYEFSNGHAFQCTRCYLVCVTQSKPNVSNKAIGKWSTCSEDEKISDAGIYDMHRTKNQIHNATANKISGLSFKYK